MNQVTYKNIEEMLNDRNAVDNGRYFLCDCPSCEYPEAFIYKNNPRQISCNRAEECGEMFLVKYENVKSLEDVKLQQMKETYPDLTDEQVEAIDWLERSLKHLNDYGHSELLENGYRGLSKKTTNGFVVDFQNENVVNYMFHKTHSLFRKDYRDNSFMSQRNLILPIYGEEGNIERVLLRSSINPNPEPKEIQLIVNPSKEARDFFVDVPDGAETIVITEALFDGLSFREIDPEVGFIALTGSQKTRQVEEYLKMNRDKLSDKNILVAMDNDKAGLDAQDKLVDVIGNHGIGKDWALFDYPVCISDPNEFLRLSKDEFLRSYERSIKAFKKDKIVHLEVSL